MKRDNDSNGKDAEVVDKRVIEPKKMEAVSQAMTMIEKQYGKGAILKLGSRTILDVPGISTGSLSLDLALGGRGIPRGRISEIYGPEASGKTTVCLHVIANAQKQGGIAAFIDVEHALDANYAKKIGVDLDNLLFSQPDYGEQALEIAETLVRSNAVDVVVIDSVAALVPKAELEGEMGESYMGLQARLMSQALRKLAGVINKSNTVVIFTNQIREKIGVFFGNPETTTGGRALKFYASCRIELRKISSIKDKDVTIGNLIKATVQKNKIAPPLKDVQLEIIFGKGISMEADVLNLALAHKVIEKSGAWFSYKGKQIGQGVDKVKDFLETNRDAFEEIKNEVLKRAQTT